MPRYQPNNNPTKHQLYFKGEKRVVDGAGYLWGQDINGRSCRVAHLLDPRVLRRLLKDDRIASFETGMGTLSKFSPAERAQMKLRKSVMKYNEI